MKTVVVGAILVVLLLPSCTVEDAPRASAGTAPAAPSDPSRVDESAIRFVVLDAAPDLKGAALDDEVARLVELCRATGGAFRRMVHDAQHSSALLIDVYRKTIDASCRWRRAELRAELGG